MGIFSFLPAILKTVGSVLGLNAVSAAGDALASTQLTPEQSVALQSALAVHEEAMAKISLDELKTVMSESLAEIESPDKFTSRARPTGLYMAYAGTSAIIAATIAGVHMDSG